MRHLSDLNTYYSLSPSELAGTILKCPECGREHKIPFKIVDSGQNLLQQIPEIIQNLLHKNAELIGVVYDRHIENKLDALFFATIEESGLRYSRIPLGSPEELLDADVEIGDQAAAGLPEGIDFLIGVGSGVISDLTKWVATKQQLPFLLVGTAASMNAYTSITGTMTEKQVKTSKWLDPASAVLLDSTLLASAPKEMTCAGIGDLLARNVSNADWKLAELIRGTYFCPVPFEMMKSYQDGFMPEVFALGKNDPHAMKYLGDAVLVSGYSMTVLDGETSPSSGSEHVISHFFDFQHEVFGLPKKLHGTQVGIGTIIMSAAFELLRALDLSDLDMDEIEQHRLSMGAITIDHRRVFGEYGRILDAVVAQKQISDTDFRPYIKGILESWDQIWEAVGPYLMPTEEIRLAMEKAGGVAQLSGVDRTSEDAIQALLYGSRYRSRYTVLDLYWELGLFPEFAPKILNHARV